MKKTPGKFHLAFTSFFLPMLFIGIMSILSTKATCQCTPPMSESCEESSVLCSLDQLNGYACNNPSTLPSPCNPLCSQGGVGHNTSWWAFVCQGGKQTISIHIGGCTTNQGIQYGIWGDCLCGEEVVCRSIPCVPPNTIETMDVELTPCKLYYLWVDGCSGDICDFTLNTTGGETPSLLPLAFINNVQTGIIEPVCAGACNYRLYVNPQPGICEPAYVWTLDGFEVGGNSNEIKLDFPDEGDFVVCVSAYIGNPRSGSLCSQTEPKCAIVKVRPGGDLVDHKVRTFCNEVAIPGGIKWHSQRIFTSGIYREQFTDGNCCKIDSVVEFKILPTPTAVEVFHISCDSTPYIDDMGRSWYGCSTKYPITLQKSTDAFKCDSTILLTSTFYTFTPIWKVHCNNGEMEINLLDGSSSICNSIDSLNTSFAWYKKEDPNHTILSNDYKLKVNSIGTYCTDVTIEIISVSQQKARCIKTVCYELKADSLFASSNQLGNSKLCINEIGVYTFDTNNTGGTKFVWSYDGNPILHSQDSGFNPLVLLSWHEPGIKNICVRSFFEQNASCLICQKVEIIKAAQAGRDFKVLGLQTKLKPTKSESGKWKFLFGPGKVNFSNSFDPNTRVSVSKVGKYIFEWSAVEKGCSDKDSITIDFFKIPFGQSHLIFFNDEEETEFSEIENRNTTENKFEIFTPNLIQSNGTTFIRMEESFSFEELEYSWMDISGNVILKNKMYSESCTSVCQIQSPTSTGMYFLFLRSDDRVTVRKIIIME